MILICQIRIMQGCFISMSSFYYLYNLGQHLCCDVPVGVLASPLVNARPSGMVLLGLSTLNTLKPTFWRKAGASQRHTTVSPTVARAAEGLHAYPSPKAANIRRHCSIYKQKHTHVRHKYTQRHKQIYCTCTGRNINTNTHTQPNVSTKIITPLHVSKQGGQKQLGIV